MGGKISVSPKGIPIIAPNPTKGVLTVSSNSNISSVEIQNLLGEQIYKSANLQSTQTTLDLSHYPKGIYIVKTQTGEKLFVQKIIYQ